MSNKYLSLNIIKRIVVKLNYSFKLNKFYSVNWNLGGKTEKTMKKNYLNLYQTEKLLGNMEISVRDLLDTSIGV